MDNENSQPMDNNELNQDEKQYDEQALVKRTIKVFADLCDAMPGIGIMNRKKRLSAYITVTMKAQQFIDAKQSTEGEILFVLSMMIRKHKDFQKAAMMASLSLPKLEKDLLTPIGFKYANDVRVNMRLSPVDDGTSIEV